jgi:type I restriction-modification system DNA methylase subunit
MKRKTSSSIREQAYLPLPELGSLWENRGVFSEHYIRSRLKQSTFWPQSDSVIDSIWVFCRDLWNKKYLRLAKGSEAVIRQEFIDKVLEKLGFAYLPNTSLPLSYSKQEPDYILFSDDETKESVIDKDKVKQYSAAVTILEAKKANHPLGAVSKRETPGRFPHQQIRDYLQEALDPQNKPYFKWAILTNGNLWRLYCRDARPAEYFEINFERAIQTLEDFKYFFVLFRPQAFIKNSEGKCLLDEIRSEALQSQTELESDLRKRVFTILERLANGFFKRKENGIDEKNLDDLYQNCLILLYRLLFILYAEGREFLPVKPSHTPGANKEYLTRYSIQRLIPRIKTPTELNSDDFTDLYEGLLKLFHLISGKNPALNKKCDVPLYNGGLFDSKIYPKIDEWRVGEKTLIDVLKGLMLSTMPAGIGDQENMDFGQTIDYADLEVRQLGSIYEGLLENHLEYDEKKKSLTLEGDSSRRKETGSYYTPDNIVMYIINNTLKPLCDEIDKSEQVNKAVKSRTKDNSFADAVLKLKVLDPAMGSGHFLVRATEFLAEKIQNHSTTALQIKTVPKGFNQEQAETAYWRRRVVEACIYGVDLNPLAVELAKLSLWLTCISTDRPLTFLDHHLRPGNSLIGAWLSELDVLPRESSKERNQIPISFGPDLLKAVKMAIEAIEKIEATDCTDISSVEAKKSLWEAKVRDSLLSYRNVANLWTSTFFDKTVNETNYLEMSRLLILNSPAKSKEGKDLKRKMKFFEDAFKNAEQRLYFYWELEFPEIFFNEDGTPKKDPGFDVVIGNPPYGAQFDDLDRRFIGFRFPHSRSNKNSAMVFIEQGIQLTKQNGYFSYIIPKSISFSQKWASGRELVLNDLGSVLDVSRAFKDVLLEQVVIVLSSKFSKKDEYASLVTDEKEKTNIFHIQKHKAKAFGTLIMGVSPEEVEIFNRAVRSRLFMRDISISSRGLPFQQYLEDIGDTNRIPIYRGDHIARYQLFESADSIPEKVLETARKKVEFLSQPKILSQNIVAHIQYPTDHISLMATADTRGVVTLDTVENTVITNKRFSLGFLTCLVNSKLFSWFAYRFVFGKAIRTMHLEDYHIGKLPICQISFSTPLPERKRLTDKLRSLAVSGKYNDILSAVDEYLPTDQNGELIKGKERSDVVHDLLSFLAEHMTEMNKRKYELTHEFLAWLEREITKKPIEKLKDKNKIREFCENDLNTLAGALKQNGIFPRVLEMGDTRFAVLEKAYNDTMTELQPIKSQLASIDNLIDRIVFRLYGLTTDEIELIEAT